MAPKLRVLLRCPEIRLSRFVDATAHHSVLLIAAFVKPLGARLHGVTLVATQCIVESQLGLVAQALTHEVLILSLEVGAGIVILKSFLIFVQHTVVFGNLLGENHAAPRILIAFAILTGLVDDLSESVL